MVKHDYAHPTIMADTETPKTANEFREAIKWLTDHGFKGHFYDVPPEVIDDFKDIEISPGYDGFYLAVRGDIDLWVPLELNELTSHQRQLIEEKLGMSPEAACAEESRKSAEYKAEIEKPVSKGEKETAFRITLYNAGEIDLAKSQQVVYMWPEVSAWTEHSHGVGSWKFDDRISISFRGKNKTVYPINISVKAPFLLNFIKALRKAIKRNEKEVAKRK